ncbi:MAG TPA: hypothetical protein DDW98_13480 [Gammaproteobacteria bacterium]|nr:hypothetical protein [Gammaproteobacteria bacterium]
MTSDARVSTALPSHPKTKKLIRRIGPSGAWKLVCLFLWAAANKPSGDLSGLSDEDIELAIDWDGEEGAFVAALAQVGFLDGPPGGRSIHDWQDHNRWALGAEERRDGARLAALIRHHGKEKGERMFHAERAGRSADSCGPHAERTESASDDDAARMRTDAERNAPFPLPSPLPKPPKSPRGDSPTAKRDRKRPLIELKAYCEQCAEDGVDEVPAEHSVFRYAEQIGLPDDYLELGWRYFRDRYWTGKRQKDWPKTFENYVKGGFLKLWYRDTEGDAWALTTAGKQAQLAFGKRAAA